MDLYLQMGHGMQQLSIDLLKSWSGGTIIISPVNIPENRLQNFSDRISSVGGKVLFDPQMFYPADGNQKLLEYSYWPTSGISVTEKQETENINQELLRINNRLNTEAIILPGKEFNEDQLDNTLKWLNQSINYFRNKTSKKLYATVCVYPETVRNTNSVESLIDALKNLSVDGFYVIAHPSNDEYIVSDSLWMIGVMKLLVCLKRLGKVVIAGYSNHQSLIYSLANIDAIASGTYMNTRSFVPKRFKYKSDDDIKHKSTWYYLPTAFCEYKANSLDVAKQRNYLDLFESTENFSNEYSSVLFKGAMPSSTNYNESSSFRHYLYCLREQCKILTKNSYEETSIQYAFMLDVAENQINAIKQHGMSGQNRDFAAALEVNRVAMCAIDEDYGLKLKLDW